jgi:hypothetical protein
MIDQALKDNLDFQPTTFQKWQILIYSCEIMINPALSIMGNTI